MIELQVIIKAVNFFLEKGGYLLGWDGIKGVEGFIKKFTH